MDGFLCVKPLTLSGTGYLPGSIIPADAVLPNRVRALMRMGYIAAADERRPPAFSIPIFAENGERTALAAGASDVVTAAILLQSTVEQASEAIRVETNRTALTLIRALDSRKGVKNAASARLEELNGGDA